MYEVKNAIIRNVTLSNADHGVLSAFLHLDYGDGGAQGFGGYMLYTPKHPEHSNYAGHFIWRCLEIAEVSDWNQLPGRTIRVRIKDSVIHFIGHIVKDLWFCPKEEFNNLKLGASS